MSSRNGSVWAIIMCGTMMLTGQWDKRAAGQIIARDLYTLSLPPGMANLDVQPAYQPAVGGQVVGSANNNLGLQAVLWNGTGTAIDLTSTASGYSSGQANGTDGFQQVGVAGGPATGGVGHAVLWTGAGSIVDLAPTNLPGATTVAIAIGGTQIVGIIESGNSVQALLWNGPSNTAVNLNPFQIGISQSYPLATDGHEQVGYGWSTNSSNAHALLWTGTAASAVDLNPSGFTFTHAIGVGSGQQVGSGFGTATGGDGHALLWTGTANSVVDLNSFGLTSSDAFSTNGTWQVGSGVGPSTSGVPHAFLWNGSASSGIDLEDALPAEFTQSEAFSIDAAGDIFGLATDSGGNLHAVEWVVPEPNLLPAIGGAALAMLLRLRRR